MKRIIIRIPILAVLVLVGLFLWGKYGTDGRETVAVSAEKTTSFPAAGTIQLPADRVAAPTEKPEPVAAPAAAAPSATDVMVGKKLKTLYQTRGKFQTRNNVRVFVQPSGQLYKSGFFLNGKHVYYARKTGEIQRGWIKLRGNTYFFTRKTGSLTSQPVVEDVVMDKYGIAKYFSLNNRRVETYLKATKVYRKITSPSDTKAEKLYKCYKWVMQYPYAQHRKMKEMMAHKEWQKRWDLVFAEDIFDTKCGCCVSYSASLALLAKECGYKNITLCSDTEHAWDDIGGRLYDPLFAKVKSFSRNYNATYSDYRSHAAIKKRIK